MTLLHKFKAEIAKHSNDTLLFQVNLCPPPLSPSTGILAREAGTMASLDTSALFAYKHFNEFSGGGTQVDPSATACTDAARVPEPRTIFLNGVVDERRTIEISHFAAVNPFMSYFGRTSHWH